MEQKLINNVVYYKDNNGWEDPSPVDLGFQQFVKPKVIFKNQGDTIVTKNRFFNTLINNFIGRRFFFKSSNSMRKILLDMASEKFEIHLINKYGSLHNYQKYRIKKRWGMTFCQYKNMMACSLGFKNKNDMQLQRMFKLRKIKKPTYTELNNYYAKKRGFKSAYEYQQSLKLNKDSHSS